MTNIDNIVSHWKNRPGNLAARVNKALVYREAAARGEISPDELTDLLNDLKRLDNIELAASELDQQIAFDECLTLLSKLPLP